MTALPLSCVLLVLCFAVVKGFSNGATISEILHGQALKAFCRSFSTGHNHEGSRFDCNISFKLLDDNDVMQDYIVPNQNYKVQICSKNVQIRGAHITAINVNGSLGMEEDTVGEFIIGHDKRHDYWSNGFCPNSVIQKRKIFRYCIQVGWNSPGRNVSVKFVFSLVFNRTHFTEEKITVNIPEWPKPSPSSTVPSMPSSSAQFYLNIQRTSTKNPVPVTATPRQTQKPTTMEETDEPKSKAKV